MISFWFTGNGCGFRFPGVNLLSHFCTLLFGVGVGTPRSDAVSSGPKAESSQWFCFEPECTGPR